MTRLLRDLMVMLGYWLSYYSFHYYSFHSHRNQLISIYTVLKTGYIWEERCKSREQSGQCKSREHSGSVVECLTRDQGIQPHQLHCVVSLSKKHLFSLSTDSTQEDPSRRNWKIVDWYVKNQIKQTNIVRVKLHGFCDFCCSVYTLWSLQVNSLVLDARKPVFGVC